MLAVALPVVPHVLLGPKYEEVANQQTHRQISEIVINQPKSFKQFPSIEEEKEREALPTFSGSAYPQPQLKEWA